MFGDSIGDIIYYLYDAYNNSILPMLRTFVDFITSPLIDNLPGVSPVEDLVFELLELFNLTWVTPFQLMIGSGISFYLIWRFVRFFTALLGDLT